MNDSFNNSVKKILDNDITNSEIIEEFNNDITEEFDETLKISDSDLLTDKELYSFEDMKKLNLNEVYNLLKNANFLMFINENTIKMKIGFGCFGHRLFKVGILMISTKYIESLKKIIHKWNNYLNNNKIYKSKNIIDKNRETLNNIIFENNVILCKTLYSKMIIQDKIIFSQYKDNLLKKIEYKLRGFCQIMEEMGASKIMIDFDSINKKLTKHELKLQGKFNDIIASNLGFTSLSSSVSSANQNYELSYPDYNNTILNKNEIEKYIKEGKFIINFNDYQSNLEFQSVVQSRCNHFINEYSTVFSINNESVLDVSVKLFLGANNIDFGQAMNIRNKIFSKTIIKTHVKFINDKLIYHNLNSRSISLDETGFKYLIKSLQYVDFNKIGVLKINKFIDNWVEEKLKNFSGKNYYVVINLLNQIKKHIELEEYNNLLLNYFNKYSQWVHFSNFINVLTNKTISYDKIGYLAVINKQEINKINLINYLVKLILKKSVRKNVVKQIFTHETNKLIFFFQYYLIKVNHLANFNWDNILNIIEYINSLPLIDIDDKLFFNNGIFFIKNFHKHFFYNKFYKKVIAKLLHKKYYNTKNKNYISEYFIEYIKIYQFIDYNIDSLDKFNNMIEVKMKTFLELKDFFLNQKIIAKNTNLYCQKKLRYYYQIEDIEIINKYLINEYYHKNNLFKKICYYNDKINFSNELCDYFSYDLLKSNIHFGFNCDNQIYSFIETLIKQLKSLLNKKSDGFSLIDTIDIDTIANKIKLYPMFNDFLNNIIVEINISCEIIPEYIVDYLINI
tara:strand:- start:101 stop:2473 length:2373 start_codon:yes stop_codon:yes gene_type:complete